MLTTTIRQKASFAAAALLVFQIGFAAITGSAAASDTQMTKFRVYQNEKALREFASEPQAIAYARSFRYSHVEKIANRQWLWSNMPRYIVSQSGISRSNWEFQSYSDALTLAKTLPGSDIRDLEQPGWIFSHHIKYQLYQGDKTMPKWGFATLAAAKMEALHWDDAHIMDIASNQWIWDNLSTGHESAKRNQTPVYDIVVEGQSTRGPLYAFLRDAIRASAATPRSQVLNTLTSRIVHSNLPDVVVEQNGGKVREFYDVDHAAAYAKTLANSEVVKDNTVWWTNIPYLQVYQGHQLVRSFHTRSAALTYAGTLDNSTIVTTTGRMVWDNTRKLLYLGWNGVSTPDTILRQTANTQGLDIDSPSWFELDGADGTLADYSTVDLVRQLKSHDMQITPLVSNRFDTAVTSAFLRDEKAKQAFINALLERLTALGVNGVNMDFEGLAAKDRSLYNGFIQALADAAHKKKLTVSIDLPRGDMAWNHLTAYDFQKLAGYVDTVIIMAYDQFWKGSDTPGSVAGLQWTEQGVVDFLNYGIPRSKIMLGVPFYILEWKLDGNGKLAGSRAILMKDLPALLASVQAEKTYDPTYNQTKYTYVKDGFEYVLWAETETTVKSRIDIAQKYDLAGVAAWRLGYENGSLWTMMLREK